MKKMIKWFKIGLLGFLGFCVLIFVITLIDVSNDDEQAKETAQVEEKIEFKYDGHSYVVNLDMPLGNHYHESTVLNEHKDKILNTIKQFKQLENKEEYDKLTICFLSGVGEFVDKNGNTNEEPKCYGWLRLEKDDIENINIEYFTENYYKLFENYEYSTIGLNK